MGFIQETISEFEGGGKKPCVFPRELRFTLRAGANTRGRAVVGWIRESASQRHPGKRQRRVVHHAAYFRGFGLHAAKNGGRGESERAEGGEARTQPC